MLVLAVVLLTAACSSDTANTTTTTPDATATTTSTAAGGEQIVPTSYEEFRTQPTACNADAPEAVESMEFESPDDMGVTDGTTVVIATSCGDITVELLPSMAPATVNSFVFLAEQGYFDGSVSHRVVPGFMMQAGDPTGTGRGGPGYSVPDEYPSEGFLYERGMLAMANAGPGTTGSQFFIMMESVDWLPPNYTVFGSVVDGIDVLDAIASVPLGLSPTSPDPSPSTPLETVYIESVTVDG